MKINAIITDFDGTLVNTYDANLKAYQESFQRAGLTLTNDDYKRCYGLRFDGFMKEMNITDDNIKMLIKETKKNIYPNYFNLITLNTELYNFINKQHKSGIVTAIASTAAKTNLNNLIDYLNIRDTFDYIITGDDVTNGKPDPEIYNVAMKKLNVLPGETLIFEDSPTGIEAASKSNANYIIV